MFRYYNLNPKNKNENDCVCRAIALATGADYNIVNMLLYKNARKCDCDMLTKSCYRKVIEDHFGLVPRNGNRKTVGDIAKKYAHDKVLMRISGHLTCSCYGQVLDTWDCSDKIVDEFWVVGG